MSYFKFTNVDQSQDVPEVDPAEVHRSLGKIKIIDVRSEEEFIGELGHIEGAELLPVDGFPEALDQLPADETVVFVCRSGGRSARATQFALSKGLEHVYNMRGGMMLWNNLGLKTE